MGFNSPFKGIRCISYYKIVYFNFFCVFLGRFSPFSWATKALGVSRGIAVLFLGPRHSRWGEGFIITPQPCFSPRKDPVPIVQEPEWAAGPVWTGGKFRLHRDSIPDRPARSQSLYRMSYPALPCFYILMCIFPTSLLTLLPSTSPLPPSPFHLPPPPPQFYLLFICCV